MLSGLFFWHGRGVFYWSIVCNIERNSVMQKGPWPGRARDKFSVAGRRAEEGERGTGWWGTVEQQCFLFLQNSVRNHRILRMAEIREIEKKLSKTFVSEFTTLDKKSTKIMSLAP